jgi:catechol-2,3-dioxygenase
MEAINKKEIGVVQLYLPARDLDQSAEWYVSYLKFTIKDKNQNFIVLSHICGPNIMLRKTSKDTPVLFSLDEREFPVVSIMYPEVDDLHYELTENQYDVGDIIRFGEGNKYIHFHVKDPYGNKIDIGNYPDR